MKIRNPANVVLQRHGDVWYAVDLKRFERLKGWNISKSTSRAVTRFDTLPDHTLVGIAILDLLGDVYIESGNDGQPIVGDVGCMTTYYADKGFITYWLTPKYDPRITEGQL